MTQWPFLAAISRACSATTSWPWPRETLWKFLLSNVKPNFFPERKQTGNISNTLLNTCLKQKSYILETFLPLSFLRVAHLRHIFHGLAKTTTSCGKDLALINSWKTKTNKQKLLQHLQIFFIYIRSCQLTNLPPIQTSHLAVVQSVESARKQQLSDTVCPQIKNTYFSSGL